MFLKVQRGRGDKMAKMKWYDWIAYVLLIVAGLNWGIFGATRILNHYFPSVQTFDLVSWMGFGSNFVFLFIGFFAVYGIFTGIKLAMKR